MLWAVRRGLSWRQRMAGRVVTGVGPLLLRRAGVQVGDDIVLYGLPVVDVAPGSSIRLGQRVTLTSWTTHTALGVDHPVVLRTLMPSAQIEIGDDVGISGGAICAARLVSIGAGTMLGANVVVADTDFHPVNTASRRHAPLPVPLEAHEVRIGSNVFIGTNSLVLKGVRIGDHAVVGAGSVVTHDVPANTVVAGNPARPIGTVRLA